MANTFGPVQGSGQSNMAVDNLAARIDNIGKGVCDFLNERLPSSRKAFRRRRPLVLRAYPMQQELATLKRLLKSPNAVRGSEQGWRLSGKSKFPNSLAFWLLVCLDSHATRALRRLHDDDAEALHDLRLALQDKDFDSLRAVASGKIAWEQYEAGSPIQTDRIKLLFAFHLVQYADVLCSTPALTESEHYYKKFKTEKALAVVVDEAANMDRAALICVWGNTALPCFLAGDPCQFPPPVISDMERDGEGNFRNRLGNDARVSAMEWLMVSGVNFFEPRYQFRMAKGQFDYVGELVYPGVNFKYGPGCEISQPKFALGRALEAFVRERDRRVQPSPPGRLLPVFLHCPDSEVTVGTNLHSRACPTQARAALNFVLAFLEDVKKKAEAERRARDEKGVEEFGPQNVTIIAPYSANVDLINKLLDSREFAGLAGISPAAAVDSFQGREADIVVLVMGTNARFGPGFTANRKRLNVMLTRQRCGLVIVGDFGVVGDVSGKPPRGKVERRITGPDGETRKTAVTLLWNVLNRLQRDGRVMGLGAPPQGAGAGRGAGSGGRGFGDGEGGRGRMDEDRGWGVGEVFGLGSRDVVKRRPYGPCFRFAFAFPFPVSLPLLGLLGFRCGKAGGSVGQVVLVVYFRGDFGEGVCCRWNEFV